MDGVIAYDIECRRFIAMLATIDEPSFENAIFDQFLAIENDWAESPWTGWPGPTTRPARVPKPFQRPLVFGDREQIAALR